MFALACHRTVAGSQHILVCVSMSSNTAMSWSLSVKSVSWAFSMMRAGVTDLGTTDMPCWSAHRNRTCPGTHRHTHRHTHTHTASQAQALAGATGPQADKDTRVHTATQCRNLGVGDGGSVTVPLPCPNACNSGVCEQVSVPHSQGGIRCDVDIVGSTVLSQCHLAVHRVNLHLIHCRGWTHARTHTVNERDRVAHEG